MKLLVLLLLPLMAIGQAPQIIGHRGSRGTVPENTLPSLMAAADAGAHYLEIDLVVSADGQVVISHEPWLNPDICLDPEGNKVPDADAWNLYHMTYLQIKHCDCGTLRHPQFPQQQNGFQYKPLLSEAVGVLQMYCRQRELAEPLWLIEIKYTEGDTVHYPALDKYVQLLHTALKNPMLKGRMVIQSFSPQVLNALHKLEPVWPYGLLLSNQETTDANLAKLDFMPQYYNPHHTLITPMLLEWLHSRSLKCMAWTVNDKTRAAELTTMGVDGIITDYPALLLSK